MAEQTIEIRYFKSPLWRVVAATGAVVAGIGTSTAGMEINIRFTFEWQDVEKETFVAEVDSALGTMTAKAPSQVALGQLSKIEEVAVKMPVEGAIGLISALLNQPTFFNDSQKQRLRDEFAKFPKP